MRNMFSTDFKKLVALILVCFLLTNLWTIYLVGSNADRVIDWVNLQTGLLDLGHEKLQGRLCVNEKEEWNAKYCEKLRQSVPGK